MAQVLRLAYPDIAKMLPIEDRLHVTFEWIGRENYLGEKASRTGQRTRGANCTSADAVVLFERQDGKRQAVLIEWKYTESYHGNDLRTAASGTDRTGIYMHLYQRDDCPLDKRRLPGFEALFYEPFYQFMRQQFLAHEMEKAHELGADIVSVLHLAPAHNTDFRRITSPALQALGGSATSVWQSLVKPQGRFLSVNIESLFGSLTEEQLPRMKPWLDYIHARYGWVRER